MSSNKTNIEAIVYLKLKSPLHPIIVLDFFFQFKSPIISVYKDEVCILFKLDTIRDQFCTNFIHELLKKDTFKLISIKYAFGITQIRETKLSNTTKTFQ